MAKIKHYRQMGSNPIPAGLEYGEIGIDKQGNILAADVNGAVVVYDKALEFGNFETKKYRVSNIQLGVNLLSKYTGKTTDMLVDPFTKKEYTVTYNAGTYTLYSYDDKVTFKVSCGGTTAWGDWLIVFTEDYVYFWSYPGDNEYNISYIMRSEFEQYKETTQAKYITKGNCGYDEVCVDTNNIIYAKRSTFSTIGITKIAGASSTLIAADAEVSSIIGVNSRGDVFFESNSSIYKNNTSTRVFNEFTYISISYRCGDLVFARGRKADKSEKRYIFNLGTLTYAEADTNFADPQGNIDVINFDGTRVLYSTTAGVELLDIAKNEAELSLPGIAVAFGNVAGLYVHNRMKTNNICFGIARYITDKKSQKSIEINDRSANVFKIIDLENLNRNNTIFVGTPLVTDCLGLVHNYVTYVGSWKEEILGEVVEILNVVEEDKI